MIVDIDDPFPRDAVPAPGSRRLAERAAAGSHDAWEQIFRSIYPRLRSYAARRVGDDVADDIVSETMTRAIANIGKFRPTDAGMDPWLFGIARRVRGGPPPPGQPAPNGCELDRHAIGRRAGRAGRDA